MSGAVRVEWSGPAGWEPWGGRRGLRRRHHRGRLRLQALDSACLLNLPPGAEGDEEREHDADVAPHRRLVVDEVLDHGEEEDERAEDGGGHRLRHRQRDVDCDDPYHEPRQQHDRQQPEEPSARAVPGVERQVGAERLGDLADRAVAEVLPRQEQVDEEQHPGAEHDLRTAGE